MLFGVFCPVPYLQDAYRLFYDQHAMAEVLWVVMINFIYTLITFIIPIIIIKAKHIVLFHIKQRQVFAIAYCIIHYAISLTISNIILGQNDSAPILYYIFWGIVLYNIVKKKRKVDPAKAHLCPVCGKILYSESLTCEDCEKK